jgi:hypothetical protein
MHLSPTLFPPGIPGMGDEIDKAIQQAPQPIRHSINIIKDKSKKTKVRR